MRQAVILYVPEADQRYLDMAAKLAAFLPAAQIIAVADEADDSARGAWAALSDRFQNIAFYALGVSLGKGAALRTGVNLCSADYIALLDPDGIVDHRSLREYFEFLENHPDIDGVVGDRWDRRSNAVAPAKRRITSFIFAAVVRMLFGLKTHDPQSPLKVFKQSALLRVFEDLRLHDRGFDVELLFQCRRDGLRVVDRALNWKAVPARWPVIATALRVVTALLYVRVLSSKLGRLPLVAFLGRPHVLPVKRSYSIVIFCWRDPANPDAGGSEVYLQEQAKCWVANGHRVTWFAARFPGSLANQTIDGIRIVRRGAFPWLFLCAPFWYLFKSGRSFDFIIDCMNGIPFFTPLYSTKPKVCLLYHIHSPHFRAELPRPAAALACAVETRIAPFVYRKTRFITVSESSKRDIEAHRIARLPVDLIYSGVASTLVPGAKSIHPTVLYLGRVKKYKRVRKLIDAFAFARSRVLDAELVIAGTGDDETELREYVADLGLQGVRFMGRVDDATKIRLMQEAWVFGMPSGIEGWGIVVIEANACATPAVGYTVAGIKDCIIHRKTGLLAQNDTEFAEHLLSLLTDPALLSAMSQRAYAWSRRFSWTASAGDTLEQIRRAQPWRAVFEPDLLNASLWRLMKRPTAPTSRLDREAAPAAATFD